MIARLWTARTTHAQSPAYVKHFQTEVLPALARIAGYSGVMLLERSLSEAVELIVVTYWRSLEALREFAGTDIEQAVVADQAAAMLSAFDKQVRHFEVVLKDA